MWRGWASSWGGRGAAPSPRTPPPARVPRPPRRGGPRSPPPRARPPRARPGGGGGPPPPRGRRAEPPATGQATKLDSTSLQHAIRPVEAQVPAAAPLRLPTGAPVAVASLHAQLTPLAWAFDQAAPGARLGYVQTAGGA